MAKVSIDDLEVAIQWLEVNEGTEFGEAESCKRVADFLRTEMQRRQDRARDQQLARAVSAEVGRKVTAAEIRKKTLAQAARNLRPVD